MTIQLDRPQVAEPAVEPSAPAVEEGAPAADPYENASPFVTTVAAFLATAGAAWVIGGAFASAYARIAGIGAALVGAALVALSYRARRPGILQALVVPAAIGLSAVLVIPEAGGDLGELPGFVVEAFQDGGLSTPPVPFDPGWRVIVVVLCAAIVAAAASLAVSFAIPRLAVAIPVVVIIAGMLVQPERGETVTALVALVLALAGLAVSFGAELRREGTTSGRFELRRLVRGAAVVVALAAGLAGLSQVGFLFPTVASDRTVPPQPPGQPQAQEPGVVFTADGPPEALDLVWRVGVLDSYGEAENAWLTPPFDPDRLVELPADGVVPAAVRPAGGETVEARVTMGDRGGRALPVPASTTTVAGTPVEYDPRTDVYQAAGRLADGTSYTVTATVVDPAALAGAPPADLAEYRAAPEIPPLVRQLLLTAPPESEGPAARLEFVRQRMYENVVAEGVGVPTEVSPQRAEEIIVQQGTKATPYEITAADALLARWVGIPSRIGYGYYAAGAEPNQDGVVEVQTTDAATWLETYHEGVGWVPTLKTPQQVPPPAEEAPRNEDPQVRAGEDRALLVYVPVEVQSVRLAYESVGYWLLATLPWVAVVLLVWMWYPAVLKVLRRGRRRRWAAERGVRERIAVVYSDLRDVAHDFGIGHTTQTPIEFLDAVDPDPEHRELAWLVSRALWGDLTRDPRIEDADAAEDMARSVRKRLARAQPPPMRVLAGISRVSLRDPYSAEVPNLWPRRSLARAVAAAVRGVVTAPGTLLRRPVPASGAIVVVALLLVGAAAGVGTGRHEPPTVELDSPATALEPPVPEKIQEFTLLRSPSAERAFAEFEDRSIVTDGRVYEIYQGATQHGLLQIAWLEPGIGDRDLAKRQILASIEVGEFTFTRMGEERAYVKELPDDANFVVWFGPEDRYYQLFVTRAALELADLERIVKGLLAFQRGDRHEIVNLPVPPGPPDPLLGSDG